TCWRSAEPLDAIGLAPLLAGEFALARFAGVAFRRIRMSFVASRRLVIAAALSLLPLAALAHGPSRQKVVEKIEIDAPVAKTEGTGGNAVGAKRTITFKKGGSVDESVTKYDADSHTLSYKIDKDEPSVVPVANYSSTISVKEEGGKSVVEWKGAFYRGFLNNDPPPELTDEAALKAITDFYQTGLAALKAKAEGK